MASCQFFCMDSPPLKLWNHHFCESYGDMTIIITLFCYYGSQLPQITKTTVHVHALTFRKKNDKDAKFILNIVNILNRAVAIHWLILLLVFCSIYHFSCRRKYEDLAKKEKKKSSKKAHRQEVEDEYNK